MKKVRRWLRQKEPAVAKESKTISRLREGVTSGVSFSALSLIGILCACSTTGSRPSVESKTANTGFEATTAEAQSDYATNPTDVFPRKEGPSKGTGLVQPWLVLKSISFFYNRADLAGWEAIKMTEIATYVAIHPGVELGINQPAAAAEGDLNTDALNQRRVRTVVNGLIAAGVSENKIHVGNYRDLPLSTDQQVEVFVRAGL